ncbi:nicotinate/nicotinamide nucleotide adenylyltransferase [Thermobacillus composti KWC4]|uniref:Probable nicotinate-nucleotide adenylyltransferase n=1 Tax=Thermobacillus composti (strain DSM 18247 / JCM 13945 / KWC4) TaxID=717605 RepID=L0EHA2_THECK|nr:nicotinate-nucleotide adenylyltransferase [Thermobacillus composti]AGA58535.1 nicotinate/nicotinamide nucleotide adenylyltransferase [Thermobacillus composti KWC4]
MKRVGLMGGTFDPIHIGHLLAAETAREQCGLDEVWFIPSRTPPLKSGAPSASGEDRLEMVRLAIAGQPAFKALDLELRRPGISYSIDTVHELSARCPGCSFAYIIGGDRVNDLPRWHRIDELAASVAFIGVARPGHPVDIGSLPESLRGRVRIIPMPQLDISSSAIRALRREGRSVRYLVPDGVHDFIVRKGLYGS